jgi:hypothetical protein
MPLPGASLCAGALITSSGGKGSPLGFSEKLAQRINQRAFKRATCWFGSPQFSPVNACDDMRVRAERMGGSHMRSFSRTAIRPSSTLIPYTKRRRIMKRSLALALATFLGLGLLSTSFAAFAQDAYGGITNSRGGYNQTTTYTR